jgi:hypothetical protein
VASTRAESGPYRQRAWQVQPVKTDAEVDQVHPGYDHHTQREYAFCIEAMRAELSVLPPLLRRQLRRRATRL